MAKQRYTFVLRLWLETEVSDATAGRILRGSLEVVGSKKTYYFNSFDRLLALLRTITGWQDRSDSSGQAREEVEI